MIHLLRASMIPCLLLMFCTISLAAQDWQTTAQKVVQLAQEMDDRTATSAAGGKNDKEALTRRLHQLQQRLAALEKQNRTAAEQLTTLSQKRAGLASRYEKDMADMKTVEGVVRTAIRQSIKRAETSPVSTFAPERLQTMTRQLEQQSFLGLQEISAYTSILRKDMHETGSTATKRVEIITPDGHIDIVELHRGGGFFLGYGTDKGVFVLPNGSRPATSLLSNSSSLHHKVAQWSRNDSEIVPIDITHGAALRALEQKQDLADWLEAGGVLLYPILMAGVVGLLAALGKTLHLCSQSRLGSGRKEQLFTFLQEGQLSDAATFLQQTRRCPTARVLQKTLGLAHRPIDILDNALQEGYLLEMSKLERCLSLVGILASIAPLLGLLGTVTGMIDTFQSITIFGTGDPQMMSTGISEALVTTQAGLGIAIPLLLIHHFLKRRITFLLDDMEVCGTALGALLGARHND